MTYHKIVNVACWTLLLLFAGTVAVQAHGTMYDPPSRGMVCYDESVIAPQSDACRNAKQINGETALYDWDSVSQLPNGAHRIHVSDGQLCNGGQRRHAGLGQARYDWPIVPLLPDENGNVHMSYVASAPHATLHWRFYVTKDSWITDTQAQEEGESNRRLYWSDLEDEPFCELGNIPQSGGEAPPIGPDSDEIVKGWYEFECPAPPDKDGQHIIYAIWQRSDSPEAFYSCSDVILGSAALTPTPTPLPSLCNALDYSGAVVYTEGDRAVHNNQEWEAKWWVKGGVPGRNAAWKRVVDDCGAAPPTNTPMPMLTATPTAIVTDAQVDVTGTTPTPEPGIPLSVGQSTQPTTPHNDIIVLMLVVVTSALLVTGATLHSRRTR